MTIPVFWNANWTAALLNHVWQSTVVVGAAWLLALVLRKNHARVRYCVWLAASVKFLLPFVLLISAGDWLRSLIPTPTARPVVTNVVQQVTQPFGQMHFFDSTQTASAGRRADWLLWLLLASWACGMLVVFARFARGWRKAYAAKRAASPIGLVSANRIVVPDGFSRTEAVVDIPRAVAFSGRPSGSKLNPFEVASSPAVSRVAPFRKLRPVVESLEFLPEIPVLNSPETMEPGIVGIFRPVLLLPEGILERLTAEQMRAIVAHEMCHVRRRDNLTFAIHMLVQALFWFHPAVWWIGRRLIDEREQACDEAVIEADGERAQIYAEGILNVCKFYLESPVTCVSGVKGGDLKKRITRIMTNLTIREIGVGRKLLLVAVLVIAIAAPLAVGIIHMVSVNAQATALDGTTAMAAAYEVVSVKPAKPACADVSIAIPPGGLTAHCITLWGLIYNAYEVRSLRDHPPGLPGWADKDRFDVDARMNDQLGAALRRLPLKEQSEQRRLMMRAFLSDRFHLRVHYESRPEPIYELVVAKAGPKVKPLPADEKSGAGAIYDGSPSRIKIEGNSMSSLAFWLSQTAGRTVVDKTGLAGNYDIELKWTPDDQQGAADAGPTLFTALQEQLGLKLHPAKGSVRTLVIDHADKPSSN